jgi:hypothetical protein
MRLRQASAVRPGRRSRKRPGEHFAGRASREETAAGDLEAKGPGGKLFSHERSGVSGDPGHSARQAQATGRARAAMGHKRTFLSANSPQRDFDVRLGCFRSPLWRDTGSRGAADAADAAWST